jgi:pyruvate/2-oxoglutarate dehydrogenase complex dihydrolipoamide dehydrogenase (E3) component
VDRFDVIIIGMGMGGDAAAGRLLAAGRRSSSGS